MIWATVSSWSRFCWLYTAFPSLAAKNRINLILVLTIWLCTCVVFSCVAERGCLLWLVRSLGKTLLAFALLHSVLQGQICLLLQVFLDFLLLHSKLKSGGFKAAETVLLTLRKQTNMLWTACGQKHMTRPEDNFRELSVPTKTHQDNGDFSPTATRSWILTVTRDLGRGLWAADMITASSDTLIQPGKTLSRGTKTVK